MGNYNKSTRDRVADINTGIRVDRATSLVRDKAIFNVKGGRVLLVNVLGDVTTAMHGTPNATKLTHDATNGTVVDLCDTLDLNACAQYSLLSITGAVADNMTKAESAIRGMSIPVILNVGQVKIVRAADVAGSVAWSVWYVPLEDGAYMEVEPD